MSVEQLAVDKYGKSFHDLPDNIQDSLIQEGKADTVQTCLKGMWRDTLDGCPHLHRRLDDIDRCDFMDMTGCVYELGTGPCELWEEILEEWRKEMEL